MTATLNTFMMHGMEHSDRKGIIMLTQPLIGPTDPNNSSQNTTNTRGEGYSLLNLVDGDAQEEQKGEEMDDDEGLDGIPIEDDLDSNITNSVDSENAKFEVKDWS